MTAEKYSLIASKEAMKYASLKSIKTLEKFKKREIEQNKRTPWEDLGRSVRASDAELFIKTGDCRNGAPNENS